MFALALLSLIAGVASVFVLHPPSQLSAGGKIAVSAYSLCFYLWKTIVPTGLSPLYELPKHAEALQLNVSLFQQCLDSGRYVAGINQDITDAGSVGVSGTPSFLIGVVQPNGSVKVTKKLVGAKAYADFKTILDGLLGEQPQGTN